MPRQRIKVLHLRMDLWTVRELPPRIKCVQFDLFFLCSHQSHKACADESCSYVHTYYEDVTYS